MPNIRLLDYKDVGKYQKQICPSCGHRTFVPFADYSNPNALMVIVDKEGQLVYGKCDRLNNCNYFQSPDPDNMKSIPIQQLIGYQPIVKRTYSTDAKPIDYNKLPNVENNVFLDFLASYFPLDLVKQVLYEYQVKFHDGFVWFPQIDQQGRCWTAKGMRYKSDGHREKEGFRWLHNYDGYRSGRPFVCYFGTHLVNQSTKYIFVVESEKTAIIGTLYDRLNKQNADAVWLATGGSENLNTELLQPFEGKEIILIPDKDAISKWLGKGKEWKINASWFDGLDLPDDADIADAILLTLSKTSVYKEIEATEKRLVAEFQKILNNPDAERVFIEIDAGYKVLKIPLKEFAQSNIDMMRIVKDTEIEGDENRIRQIWNEFFNDVRKNLERAKSLLSQHLDNNNPSLPDESISVWFDFLISNFKDIKWNDDAPKDMRNKAFKIIVKLDKLKKERKTKAEFKEIIDKGFEVLNEMRKSLNLEPF